jgi:hypothetical protein
MRADAASAHCTARLWRQHLAHTARPGVRVCVCVCARARVCPCPARTIRSRRREEVEPMEPWRRRLGRCLAIEEPPVRTRNMLSRCVAMLSRLRFSATQPRPGSRRDLCCRASRRKASRCRRQGLGPRLRWKRGVPPPHDARRWRAVGREERVPHVASSPHSFPLLSRTCTTVHVVG